MGITPRRLFFVPALLTVALGGLSLTIASRADPAAEAECPARRPHHADCGVHNMMVVGKQTIFLSHLPMFDSPHRFQVILEAAFAKNGKSLSTIYADDRVSHPATTMYTLKPLDIFVLSRLFSPEPAPPGRAFRGTVFRGHLERGGVPLPKLTDVEVTIKRVVYAQEIGQPESAPSTELEYILFGKAPEFFLAHRIVQAPDFDQLLGIRISGHTFTSGELDRGVSVKILDRGNTPDRRLRAGDKMAAQGHVTGAHVFLPLIVDVAGELYFEEGELASPVTFDQTPLEKAAGF